MRIVVVGGMNLDLLGSPQGALLPRDSNPGQIMIRPGGVGRNIAARLSALGAKVSLITALGNDPQADMLQNFCQENALDLSCALKTDFPSPCYLCIHDEKGDMALALSDMRAMDQLTPEVLANKMAVINAADACVLDANLSAESLSFIAQHAAVPLILDPVSCAKAPRIRSILPHLTALKPNLLEAETMTGERRPDQAAQALRRQGVQHVFISMGGQGVYYSGPDGKGIAPAIPLPSLPLTGAGDALCAGITLALLEGKSTRECAQNGCQTAHDALMQAL